MAVPITFLSDEEAALLGHYNGLPTRLYFLGASCRPGPLTSGRTRAAGFAIKHRADRWTASAVQPFGRSHATGVRPACPPSLYGESGHQLRERGAEQDRKERQNGRTHKAPRKGPTAIESYPAVAEWKRTLTRPLALKSSCRHATLPSLERRRLRPLRALVFNQHAHRRARKGERASVL
jgi:hypothetical protein